MIGSVMSNNFTHQQSMNCGITLLVIYLLLLCSATLLLAHDPTGEMTPTAVPYVHSRQPSILQPSIAQPSIVLSKTIPEANEHSWLESTAATWFPVALPATVTTKTIHSIVVHPINAATLFVATQNGLYRTDNGGISWVQNSNLGNRPIFEVVQTEKNPQRIYVRSWDTLRSDDGGITWRELPVPEALCGFVVAPSTAERLYARRCGSAITPPVVRSDDGGQSWIIPTNTLTVTFDQFAVAPDQADTLIATNYDQSWRSTDGGDHWHEIAIGMRYFAKPIFDRQNPSTLYLGHWSGLLRSRDGGLTWEDSDAARELLALVPIAGTKGAVIGGNRHDGWQFQLDEADWQATPLPIPISLQMLFGSANDPTMIYALTDQGLWRFDRQQTRQLPLATSIYLPMIVNGISHATQKMATAAAVDSCASLEQNGNERDCSQATTPAVGGDAAYIVAEEAIIRANFFRTLVGVAPLQRHPTLVVAAQNHTDYLVANYADSSAWLYGTHGEVEGKPFFTGKWPKDRMHVATYPWWGGAEIIHGLGDPVDSIDAWIATVFHRFPILEPYNHYAGYGYHSGPPVAMDVIDFGAGPTAGGLWISAAPFPLAYPADGQTDVPTGWNGAELPNPLPPGVQGPVGYPFTLQAVGGKMTVVHAELRTATGERVRTHPNPPACVAGRCLALMALEPLTEYTGYVVAARGDVGGVPFDDNWHFTTGSTPATVISGSMAAPIMDEPFPSENHVP